MTDSKRRRTFDTPDVEGVDHVGIYDHTDETPFRAIQYNLNKTTEDGTRWFAESEEYVESEEYRDAIAEKTHIPIEDIRTAELPVATNHGVI